MAESSSSGTAGTIDSIRNLANLLLEKYGPKGTLIIVVGAVAATTAWRIWSESRKDKKFYEALVEKEKTIKCLSLDVRMYKVLFFMHKMDWTQAKAEEFVIGNELADDESNDGKRRSWLKRVFRKK